MKNSEILDVLVARLFEDADRWDRTGNSQKERGLDPHQFYERGAQCRDEARAIIAVRSTAEAVEFLEAEKYGLDENRERGSCRVFFPSSRNLIAEATRLGWTPTP